MNRSTPLTYAPTATVLTAVLLLAIGVSVDAQQPRFDVSTSPQDDGYVTEGFLEAGIVGNYGVRVNFLNRLSYEVANVEQTKLSTDAIRTDRSELAIFVTRAFPELAVVNSVYAGGSYVRIDERQDSTYVQVDSLGEYGTEYRNTRDARFFSPRIGMVLYWPFFPTRDIDIDVRYTINLSPVYFFVMQQERTLEGLDVDTGDLLKDSYTNTPNKWSSPYVDQEIVLRLTKYARVEVYHSYLFLPYETMVLADNGFDLEPADDPTRINSLQLTGEFTIPITDAVSFNLGLGYGWSWTKQTSDRIPKDDQLTTSGEGYFRVGASVWAY